jgi:hypothetical protein
LLKNVFGVGIGQRMIVSPATTSSQPTVSLSSSWHNRNLTTRL